MNKIEPQEKHLKKVTEHTHPQEWVDKWVREYKQLIREETIDECAYALQEDMWEKLTVKQDAIIRAAQCILMALKNKKHDKNN